MDADQRDHLPDGSLLAAIDLGSNSFHLIIAKTEHGEMRPVEVLAEKVQLGAGLVDDRLSREAIDRGLDCLSRFAQLLGSVEPQKIRVVGTHALRQAENRLDFTLPARDILGTRVDVIYGREEARLVYLGVAHTLADDAHSRLVIDIGGGSTEFIIGQRFEPQRLESLQMGCVSFSGDYFADGIINTANYQRAYNRARLETSRIRSRYSCDHWAECVGSSGTLNAIEAIVIENGWSESGISRKALSRLEKKLLKFCHFDEIKLNGLSESRRNVIVAGVAITTALFDTLGIAQLRASKGALREGVIYDLMGRLSHEDVRERTVNALVQRYSADEPTAAIVERRCATLFSATRGSWRLENEDWELLHWAARTHEIGMAISHKHFNRHTAYLLRNADLPGFSQEEQEQLAILTQGQRGKINTDLLDGLPRGTSRRLCYLLTIIRLAVCFKYVETLEQLPEFAVQADEDSLSLGFPDTWLEAHPLTHSELLNQQAYLRRIGIELSVS
ncbi:Ppx/GppA family phosphatase [Seongchinamella sediminis]|uniref:Ppx/GppA family phosphatase n=1 Tax=Seongchinamella sediminis TaxID=2283635 RepID=A0A3L7DY33_9GAMM|nr:Ppx/GppA phosphatase family protein [Seongchinamella sediminis]RLQ21635.1 Ppx/GppA family phosphatase [Seongchinamella sediminis]